MSDLKKKVEKNSQTKKAETPASKKEEGSALRNQGENKNNVKNNDEEHNKGGHLKNNKGMGKGFDGPNYYENEQPSKEETDPEEPKKRSKRPRRKINSN
ncbi:MAG: hypothetical protein JNJ41_00390 [Bacteroidia bacterium]|nr:hypothetical protein [Bacteroidia bacterium]